MPTIQATPSGVSPAAVRALGELLKLFHPIPSSWLKSQEDKQGHQAAMELVPCKSYRELTNAWWKAMKWTDGLDHALSVMLAAIASTKSVGDQLWVKVIGPAACGKSTLCEALSVNQKYVIAKSTIRGFHSGYKSDAAGKEDNSLVAKLYDKTLVTKDGDTLLQSPNLSQILSEARDLYDSTSRTHYRNAMGKDYSGVRMTWILCGTSSLRSIDSSELGERFLDCVIMEKIDDFLEDDILWRVANRTERNLSIETDGKPETHYEPELAEAMGLTGGYITYLRENATDLLSTVDMPRWSMKKCVKLGKFIAHMRARPSFRQEETAEREFGTRLVSQLVRLAKCLAVVLNCKEVDKAVMKRVKRVALDTGRGKTLEIVGKLHETEGCGVRTISTLLGWSDEKAKYMLRFLRDIGVTESYKPKLKRSIKAATSWRLTERMAELYEDVVDA